MSEIQTLAKAIKAERVRILILFLLLVLLTGFAYVLWPRTYAGESLLLPASQELPGSLGGAIARQASSLGFSLGSSGNSAALKEQALALLTSRTVLEPFLVENEIMEKLYPDGFSLIRNLSDPSLPSLADGYDEFVSNCLAIKENARTGIISVTVYWTDPDLAAQWSVALVKYVNQLLRERAILDAEINLRFLQEELEQFSSTDVKEAIASLIEVELKNKMLANVRPDYALRFIEEAKAPDPKYHSEPRAYIFALALIALFSFGSAVFVWWRLVKLEQQEFEE